MAEEIKCLVDEMYPSVEKIVSYTATGDSRDRTYTGKCDPALPDTLHKKRRPCPPQTAA